MSGIRTYQSLRTLAAGLRDDLNNPTKPTNLILLYTYILCAQSLSQTSAVITTLFPKAECLIEMSLFAELVSRIEKAFDNGVSP